MGGTRFESTMRVHLQAPPSGQCFQCCHSKPSICSWVKGIVISKFQSSTLLAGHAGKVRRGGWFLGSYLLGCIYWSLAWSCWQPPHAGRDFWAPRWFVLVVVACTFTKKIPPKQELYELILWSFLQPSWDPVMDFFFFFFFFNNGLLWPDETMTLVDVLYLGGIASEHNSTNYQ